MSVLLPLLLACGGPPPAPEPQPQPVVEPAPAPATPAWKILAPSPLDLEAEVRGAGVADDLADLVPAAPPPAPPAAEKDRVAFHTGVVFSYTVLGGRKASKEALIANIEGLRSGLAAMGTGAGLLGTIDKAIEHVKNDTASREDFLREIDDQVSTMAPEEGWAPGDTTGPLLQAGAWLSATNLTARAIVRKGDAAAAGKLLRRPEVAAFFLDYIKSEPGNEKAGMLAGKVAEALTRLKEVSGKPELGIAEAEEIAAITDGLLALF